MIIQNKAHRRCPKNGFIMKLIGRVIVSISDNQIHWGYLRHWVTFIVLKFTKVLEIYSGKQYEFEQKPFQ